MEQEQEKNKSEEKMKKEPMYVLKEDLFVGRSLYDSFNYFNHIISHTSEEEYHNLCKTIEFGMQLLPDINKKEDQLLIERICGKEYLEEERKAIAEVYNDACEVLKDEVPNESRQKYGFENPCLKLLPQITLEANDGQHTACPPQIYEKSEKHFMEVQFNNHLPALRSIKNRIFHKLTRFEIIPKEKLTFKETMEKTRIENYKKRHAGVK